MKNLLALAGSLLLASQAHAVSYNVNVSSAPKEIITQHLSTFKQQPTGAVCIGAITYKICSSKDNTSTATYEDKVWGSPKYMNGEVTFGNGQSQKGKVVLFGNGEWKFVKQFGLLIPEGKNTGVYFDASNTLLVKQTDKKGKTTVYDIAGNTFLARIMSGTYRLSFNPNPTGASKPLVGGFIANALAERASQEAASRAIASSLKDGKGLGSSMSSGQSAGQAVSQIASSISIMEKEYLLFNEKTGKTMALTSGNYKESMQNVFSQCPSVDAKKAKKLSKKIKKVEKAVAYLNEVCK